MIWDVAEMMRGPPRAPVTSRRFPFGSSPVVGDLALHILLPGAIAFALPWIKPYMFGTPGLAAKSSISSLRKNPAPPTKTPEPYRSFRAVVVATAAPHLSS